MKWKEYKFSEFAQINPPIKLKSGESYSFVEMKDLSDGQKFCEPSTERKLSGGAKFENGDTLFARITPCLENGKICQVRNLKNGVGFGSTEFYVFRGRENISDSDFIFYLSRWDEVRAFAEMNFDGTSGRQRVPREAFDNLYLTLPRLETQQKIALVLSSLDTKIDLLTRQNKTLEQLAETYFRQWFVEEAEDGWEEKGLDEIADFLNGLACQKYPVLNGEPGLPVIKIKEMRTGITESSDYATAAVPVKYIIAPGDVLFSWSGSLDVVIWSGDKGILNQHLFKVTSESYPQWFYYYWIKHYLNEFVGIADDKATTMGHIQRHHLTDAKVKVPNDLTLKMFDKIMQPIFNKLKTNLSQIKKLQLLRDNLLPKLMSGEIELQG